MWTPTIEAVDKVNGRVQITVLYVSDVPDEEAFRKAHFATTLDGLKREVQTEIDRVSADFTFADSLSKNIGQPFDTVIIIPGPTPEEAARQKYFADVAVLQRMEQAISLKVMAPDAPEYLAQLALVKSEFKPEYADLLTAAAELKR